MPGDRLWLFVPIQTTQVYITAEVLNAQSLRGSSELLQRCQLNVHQTLQDFDLHSVLNKGIVNSGNQLLEDA